MLYKQARKVNEARLCGKPCCLSGVLPGLSPIVPHRSPAKSMTVGKGKEKEVAI